MNAFPVDCGRCRHHNKVEGSMWMHCGCSKSEYYRRPTLGGYSCAEGELRAELAELAKPLLVGDRVRWLQRVGSKLMTKTGTLVKISHSECYDRAPESIGTAVMDGREIYVEMPLTSFSRMLNAKGVRS